MKAIFADLLVVAILCVQQQIWMVAAVGERVDTVTITTDSGNPGDGVSQLTMTLYWGDFQYVCTNTPGSGTYVYSCDSNDQSPYGSQDSANPYYLKLQHSAETAPLQISMINITDVDGDWYAFDAFCIPPLMRHTMDKVISGSTSGSFCSEWQSKVSYTDLAIAGDTKFILLYVDFNIFGDRFANTANEAGVRPPNLVATGFTNGPQAQTDPIHILIQWDVGLYACSVTPNAASALFECASFSTSFCPGTPSSFFASYYFAGNYVWFNSLYFVDETNRRYSLTELCKTTTYVNSNWDIFTGAPGSCTVDFPGHDKRTHIVIGFEYTANANPVLLPDTIFDYPDDASHMAESEVLTGHLGVDSADYCWKQGECAFGYGSPFDVSCFNTSGPTSDPTSDPTKDPTADPTSDPSADPTQDSTIDPTADPTVDPTADPTTEPTADPTSDPTSDPTADPTSDPTSDPTRDPTSDPTSDPTTDPTHDPTSAPTESPTAAPTIAPTSDPTSSPTAMPLAREVSSIASTISTVAITTDVGNPGDGAVALDMTLYWGDNEYACAFTPSASTTEYSCDSFSRSAYTENAANSYFLKLQYDTSSVALQISMINITDSAGNWYAFDVFCIPPGMTHTMDAVVSGSTTGDFCVNGWQSKVSYTDLAIAGDTKFILLYVDFKIFGDQFANTVNEAGVRPPNLVATGFTNGRFASVDPIHILVRWDVGSYACSVTPSTEGETYECTPFSSTAFCPGTQSSFFASYYFEGNTVEFNTLYFRDETNRKYSLNTLCHDTTYVNYNWVTQLGLGGAATTCTVDFSGHDPVTHIFIGDQVTANANPVLIPDTIFDYPDDASHAVESEVLTGHIGVDSANYCWEQGACAFGYGSPFDVSCPETVGPMSDPTKGPTTDPTHDPTHSPTSVPTSVPTTDPTSDPTSDPTQAPTAAPTIAPTSDPAFDPTAAPTMTAAPTIAPTAPTTFSPTLWPTTTAPTTVEDDSSVITANKIAVMDALFQLTVTSFAGVCVVLCCFAGLDGVCIRKNDYLRLVYILSWALQAMDMVSDCFFVGQVSIHHQVNPAAAYSILFYASISFIVCPVFTTLYQLFRQIQRKWASNQVVAEWLKQHSKKLYSLSLFCGGAFSAVRLMNSHIFQLEIFEMGLSRRELKLFNTKRLWSVVLLENLPQLVIQSCFLWISDSFSAITMSSIVFSCASMLVTVLGLATDRNLFGNEKVTLFIVEITGSSVVDNQARCCLLRNELQLELSKLLKIHRELIEIMRPALIQDGVQLKLYIYENAVTETVADHRQAITDALECGDLSKIISGAWKLAGAPVISNLQCKTFGGPVNRNQLELAVGITATQPQ